MCVAGSAGRDPPVRVISILSLNLLVTQWDFAAAVTKLSGICYKWILSVL